MTFLKVFVVFWTQVNKWLRKPFHSQRLCTHAFPSNKGRLVTSKFLVSVRVRDAHHLAPSFSQSSLCSPNTFSRIFYKQREGPHADFQKLRNDFKLIHIIFLKTHQIIFEREPHSILETWSSDAPVQVWQCCQMLELLSKRIHWKENQLHGLFPVATPLLCHCLHCWAPSQRSAALWVVLFETAKNSSKFFELCQTPLRRACQSISSGVTLSVLGIS